MSNKNGVTKHVRNGAGNPVINNRVKTFDDEEILQSKRILRGKTEGQKKYIETIDQSIITLCDGVAGTGKTYIATAKAIEAFHGGLAKKLLFCRPVVECGKGLGFMPGDFNEKYRLYIRPFKDALDDFMSPHELKELVDKEIIEFAPPDYMRGNTYKNTIMVLDEAQNATIEQLRMFMTRIGENSRMIVTGNLTQCDLDHRRGDGYREILNIFQAPPYIDGVNVVQLTKYDIVRSSILQKIIEKIGE